MPENWGHRDDSQSGSRSRYGDWRSQQSSDASSSAGKGKGNKGKGKVKGGNWQWQSTSSPPPKTTAYAVQSEPEGENKTKEKTQKKRAPEAPPGAGPERSTAPKKEENSKLKPEVSARIYHRRLMECMHQHGELSEENLISPE